LEIRFVDVLDVAAVSFLLYQVYKLMRGSVAVRIFLGFLFLYMIFLVVQAAEMYRRAITHNPALVNDDLQSSRDGATFRYTWPVHGCWNYSSDHTISTGNSKIPVNAGEDIPLQ